MAAFIPEPVSVPNSAIPYFEESKEFGIPGRATHKDALKLQIEIRELMTKLNANNIVFTPGTFPSAPGMPKRYGFLMTFRLGTHPGRLEIAALALKLDTPARKRDALEQALYWVRDWLQTEVYSSYFRPGAVSLVPFLIGAGDKTVTEMMVSSGELPMLGSGQ